MNKLILNTFDDWIKFIGSKVHVISGGPGAFGANGKMGYLVDPNTKYHSGDSDYKKTPKISIKNVIWALCPGWTIEVFHKENVYNIYGEVIRIR